MKFSIEFPCGIGDKIFVFYNPDEAYTTDYRSSHYMPRDYFICEYTVSALIWADRVGFMVEEVEDQQFALGWGAFFSIDDATAFAAKEGIDVAKFDA